MSSYTKTSIRDSTVTWLPKFPANLAKDFMLLHAEKKVVPATRNLRTNSVSTMYYKVVITTMNKKM